MFDPREVSRHLLDPKTVHHLAKIEPELLERLLLPTVTADDLIEASVVLWEPAQRKAYLATQKTIQRAARR